MYQLKNPVPPLYLKGILWQVKQVVHFFLHRLYSKWWRKRGSSKIKKMRKTIAKSFSVVVAGWPVSTVFIWARRCLPYIPYTSMLWSTSEGEGRPMKGREEWGRCTHLCRRFSANCFMLAILFWFALGWRWWDRERCLCQEEEDNVLTAVYFKKNV